MVSKPSFVKIVLFLFAVFLWAGLSTPGFAQTPKPGKNATTPSAPENAPVTTFEPIMVTASRVEADLRDIPMSVSVVGKEAIVEHPSTKVAEQLVYVPGVSYSAGKSGPGNNGMISIRGLEAGRVLYLIDGVRQNSIFKEDMNKGLMNIDPEDIERIEVIKGPASSLYGSDAIGGVVNIITKKGGTGKPFGFKIGTILDSSTVSAEPRLSVYGDLDGFSYRFSGSGVSAQDRHLADGGTADHSSYSTQSFFGQAGYKWDGGSLNFTGQHYDSDVNEMASLYSWDDKRINRYSKDDPDLTYLASFPKNLRDTYTGALVLDRLTDSFAKFSLTGFYQHRDTIQEGKSVNGHTGYDNRLQDLADSYGATMQTDWSLFDSHFVSLGAEYLRDNLTNKSIETTGPQQYKFDATQETIALFLQDEWTIVKDIALTIGLRQSWTTTSLDHDDKDPDRTGSADDSNIVGNIGLVYSGIDNIALRAQYSQGYRIPDLASQFTGTGIYLEPNPNLKPEKSYNYEIGARYNDESFNVDASLFYNRIDDVMTTRVIGYIPGTVWSLNQTVNAATYKAYGGELAAAWKIGDTGFTPYGNLTIMRTELEHESYTTSDNRVPEAWGSLGLKWERMMAEDTRLFTDLAYRTSEGYKYDGGDNQIWYEHKSGQNVDFSIGMEVGDEHKFTAVLALKNLLDKEYEPEYYYYTGFHAVLSVAYEW